MFKLFFNFLDKIDAKSPKTIISGFVGALIAYRFVPIIFAEAASYMLARNCADNMEWFDARRVMCNPFEDPNIVDLRFRNMAIEMGHSAWTPAVGAAIGVGLCWTANKSYEKLKETRAYGWAERKYNENVPSRQDCLTFAWNSAGAVWDVFAQPVVNRVGGLCQAARNRVGR